MPEKGHRHFIKCEGILMEVSSELSLTIIFPERRTTAEKVATFLTPKNVIKTDSGQCIPEHSGGKYRSILKCEGDRKG